MSRVKKTFKWIAISVGGLFVTIIVGLMALGFAIDLGAVPAIEVQSGEELPPKYYDALREDGVLEKDEVVKYYYSTGAFNVTSGGTIMTDRRIIGYWTEDKKVQVYAYPLETIDRLVLNTEGDSFTDAEYAVAQRGDDDNSLLLILSIEADRHLEMLSALQKQIEENNARHAETLEE